MIKKNILTKVIVATFALAMVTSSAEGTGNGKIMKAASKEKEQNYIVQTVSKDAMAETKEWYGEVETISKSAQEDSDSDIVTVTLTDEEASQLQNSSKTVIVERDLIMSGFTEEENKKVYQQWNKKEDLQWNLDMINNENKLVNDKLSAKIKVAVIDSGIDFTSDVDVQERKNFIPDQDSVSPLYEDGSGHGTSVAGIIAAKDNEEGITGIDENVELYSAKVLDENNQAPISRVVEAINWAIEKNVKIINLSLGTSVYSDTLHNAVKKAADKGILVVCAAGNGGSVEYPAAFAETLAVGSVGADGTISTSSSEGDSLDVVAPGEQIMSTAAFDGLMASSGTSMAAPHVTGVAARLWEKNKNADAVFIKKLICDSAKSMGDEEHYGRGIVDLEYAMENFDEAWEKYQSQGNKSAGDWNLNTVVAANLDDVMCFDNVAIVEGRWITSDGTHEGFVDQNVFSGDTLKVLKIGAKLQDQPKYGIDGKTNHPEFHGYYHYRDTSIYTNYIGYYYLLTKMAVSYASGSYSDPSKPEWIKDSANFTELCNVVGGGIGLGNSKQSWPTILSGYTVNDRNKSLVLYGMAIHEATDAFAHSAVVDELRISNADGDSTSAKQGKYRLASAKYVAKKMLTHISNKKRGYVSDFAVPSSVTGNKFNMAYISKMASEINNTTYDENKSAFDAMNIDSFSVYGVD